MPTIHHVPDTFVIFESTAYVYGDHFREMCDRARDGKSEYIFCFVPWWLDRKNMIPLLKGEKLHLDSDEKFLVKLAGKGQKKDEIPPHDMLPEQLKWRRVQLVELQDMFLWPGGNRPQRALSGMLRPFFPAPAPRDYSPLALGRLRAALKK